MSGATVEIEDLAVGGEGVAHLSDGRVVFVSGALPGERVSLELTDVRSRFARAVITEVLEAGPERREPPCPNVALGCGGCDWQHVTPEGRRSLLSNLITSSLSRQAGYEVPDPQWVQGPPAQGYRTTVRVAVDSGRAGFRARRSNEVVLVGSCQVVHPLLEPLFGIDWEGSDEVSFRAGARTSEVLILGHRQLSPEAREAVTASWPGHLPDPVLVAEDELRSGRRAWYHEEVGGRTWRISARSFFQASPQGAEALVETVARAGGEDLISAQRPLELYGGVGLLAGSLKAASDALWTMVESSPSAVADARVNLADDPVVVVRSQIRRFRPPPTDFLVADPPRSGLAAEGLRLVGRIRPPAMVLVSCDLGSAHRDLNRLAAMGYRSESMWAVDLFPQTSHVELVTRLVRR